MTRDFLQATGLINKGSLRPDGAMTASDSGLDPISSLTHPVSTSRCLVDIPECLKCRSWPLAFLNHKRYLIQLVKLHFIALC